MKGEFMSDNAIVCKAFMTDGVSSEMCNAYEKIFLPVYPSLYEIKTFCKTGNHVKCPVRNFSILINSCRIEALELDILANSRGQE